MGRKKKLISTENENEIPVETEIVESNPPEKTENETANPGDDGVIEESEPEKVISDYEQDIKDIDNMIAESSATGKRGRKSKEEKARIAITIPGSLFVRVHNMVGTNAISALDAYITKHKNTITPDMISLDEKTIQELAPIAELAMKQMKVEENPIAAFYMMWGTAVLSNYLGVKAMIKNAMKENPNFVLHDLPSMKK